MLREKSLLKTFSKLTWKCSCHSSFLKRLLYIYLPLIKYLHSFRRKANLNQPKKGSHIHAKNINNWINYYYKKYISQNFIYHFIKVQKLSAGEVKWNLFGDHMLYITICLAQSQLFFSECCEVLPNIQSLEFQSSQKMKLSINDFFCKCDQIRRNLPIWSRLLNKSLMEKLHFFCAVYKHLKVLRQNPRLH